MWQADIGPAFSASQNAEMKESLKLVHVCQNVFFDSQCSLYLVLLLLLVIFVSVLNFVFGGKKAPASSFGSEKEGSLSKA